MLTTEWQKSSRSGGNGGDCVEVRLTPEGDVQVRDSKLSEDSPIFGMKPDMYRALLAIAKSE